MKSMSSRDGKMHGNSQMVERYDSAKGGKMKMGMPNDSGGDSGGEHEPMGMDQIKQVAMEHGPATKMEMMMKDGMHMLTSHHEDGHKHMSMHESPAEMHAAGAHLGGVSDGNELMEAHNGNQEEDTMNEAGHRGMMEKNSRKMHMGGGFMPEHGME